MSEQIQVEHDPQKQRFSAQVNGHQAVLEYRTIDAQTLDFFHTYVPDQLRGQGVAALLAEAAFAYAQQQQFKVVPTCSYIAAYMRRHPL